MGVGKPFCALLIASLLLLSACDLLFVDEEIREIAKSGTYQDCASLDTSENKDRVEECYSYVGRQQDDPAACNAATGRHRDNCYEDIAADLKRPELCDEISTTSTKHDCFTGVAIAMEDPELCTRMNGKDADRCYEEYATETGDKGACIHVKDESLSDQCYVHFAVAENDIILCSTLNKDTYRDQCYARLAERNSDITYCTNIEQEAARNRCRERIKEVCENTEKCEEAYGVVERDGNLYLNSEPGEVLELRSEDLPGWARGKIATVGANIAVAGPPDTITEGDPNVLLDGLPIARVGDGTAHGGNIVEGSEQIFVNGRPVAIIGGYAVDPMVTGTVPNVGGPIMNNQ